MRQSIPTTDRSDVLPGDRPSARIRNFLAVLCLLTLVTWIPAFWNFQYEQVTLLEAQPDPSVPAYISRHRPSAAIVDGWVILGDATNVAVDGDRLDFTRQSPNSTLVSRHYPLTKTQYAANSLIQIQFRISSMTGPHDDREGQDVPFDERFLMHAWYTDASGERLSRHQLMTLSVPGQQVSAQRLLSIPQDARQLDLTLAQRKSILDVTIDELRVALVRETAGFRYFHNILRSAWGLLVLIAAWYVLPKLSIGGQFAIAAIVTVLFGGILLSESLTVSIVIPAYQWLVGLFVDVREPSTFYLYKIGHSIVFFALSLLLFVQSDRLRLRLVELLAILLLIAIATEGLQLTLFHRTTRWQDILTDIAGVMIALTISRLSARGNRGGEPSSPPGRIG